MARKKAEIIADTGQAENIQKPIKWADYVRDMIAQQDSITQRAILQLQEHAGALQVRVIKQYMEQRHLFKSAMMELADRADKEALKKVKP